MLIDILKYKDNPYRCEHVIRNQVFMDYKNDPEASLPLESLVAFVILLYSKDSHLNKKPMSVLAQRRRQACQEVDLDHKNQQVVDLVFNMGSEKVIDLILGYLISQNELLWTEYNILEAQIQENHRLRFSPIKNKKEPVKKKKKKGDFEEEDDEPEEEDDSKYHIEASDKKSKLTDHFDKYYSLLKRYEQEIFGDHEDIKKEAGRKKRSLESMAR